MVTSVRPAQGLTHKRPEEILVERENEWPPGREALRDFSFQTFRVLMVGLEGNLGRRRGRTAQEGRETLQEERGMVHVVEEYHSFHA